jgi:tRNA(Arg) A34 adenosine deaminase TadA
MSHEEHLRHAIRLSREMMHEGQGGPFAALVVVDDRVVGEGWNQVTSHNDPTAHAEVVAVREACRALGTFSLEGAVLYTSCEPCPMCLAAAYWAHVSRVYYANTTADAAAIGFDDGFIYDELAKPAPQRALPCQHLAVEGASSVFAEWAAMPGKVEY